MASPAGPEEPVLMEQQPTASGGQAGEPGRQWAAQVLQMAGLVLTGPQQTA